MVIVTSNGSNLAVSLIGIDKVKLSTELSVEPELFASKTVRHAPLATFSNERLLAVSAVPSEAAGIEILLFELTSPVTVTASLFSNAVAASSKELDSVGTVASIFPLVNSIFSSHNGQ